MDRVSLSHNGRTGLDVLLRAAVEQHDVPGVVAEVANRERVLYRGAFGRLDERGAVEMAPDAIFQTMSMTKPVTSVGFMMLKEQGLFALDDPLGKYLPEFNRPTVIVEVNESDGSYTTRPATREITLRHLMTHTAGIGYDFSGDALRILGNRVPYPPPLLHDPGIRWTYGMGTRFIGKVIEQVAREPLDEFFRSRIFDPLGMRDTSFDLKAKDRGRLAALFQRVDGELVGEPRPESYAPLVFGDYGLLSTADDYARFLQMLLNLGQLGGVRLLTEQSVTEMTGNQIGPLLVEEQCTAMPNVSSSFPLGAGEDKFGFGFQLKDGPEDGSRSRGSFSWAGLYNTHFWADPRRGVAAVLLMQLLPFYDARCIRLLTDFEKHLYGSLG